MKAVVYLVLAFLVGSSCSTALCPFPGIPKNGFGHLADNHSEELSWDKKQLFQESDRVMYNCFNGWKIPLNNLETIKCGSDGSWSGPVPKCEKAIHGSSWETEFFIVRAGTLVSKISDTFICDDLLPYKKFHLQPKNTQLNVKFISDIRVELCQDSSGLMGMNMKVQQSANTQPCEMILERSLVKIFRCPSTGQDPQDTLEFLEIEVLENTVHLKDVVISISTDDYCGLPAFPVNGNTTEAVSANEYKYTCNEGFDLVGEETATCTPTTGQWTSVPLCTQNSSNSSYTITAAVVAILIAILAIVICIITLNRKYVIAFESPQDYVNRFYTSPGRRCCRNRAAKVPWDPNAMDSPTASAYAPEIVITGNYPDEGHLDDQLPDDSSIAEQVEYENEQREYDDVDDRVSSD